MPKGLFAGNTIHGYKILEDFKVAGGMSKISFARKGGNEYFIKEFLNPKYPTEDSPGSEKIKAQKRKACEEFEKQQKEINSKIATKVSTGGNFVMAVDFFREGPFYYKVTERIDTASISCQDISKSPLKDIIILVRTVCHSVRILHDLKIVHGDLKPDNILLKKTTGGYSGKLIDFDNSYFEKRPPAEREEFVGTPDYYSPEADDYVKDEDEEISGDTLTLKSDVFTLGIIFCEYFTGDKPIIPKDCRRVCDCVKKGKDFKFAKKLPNKIDLTLRKMLSLNPSDRPSIKDVFDLFNPSDTELTDYSTPKKDSKPAESTPSSEEPKEKFSFKEKPFAGLRSTFSKVSKAFDSITSKMEAIPKTAPAPDPKPASAAETTDDKKPVSRLRGKGLKIAAKK